MLSILIGVSFYTNRLREFLETETDVDISTQPALEDQTLDFSDVEQLLGSINATPGMPLSRMQTPQHVRYPWALRETPGWLEKS